MKVTVNIPRIESLFYSHIYLFRLKDGKLKIDKRPLPKYWAENELYSLVLNATGDIKAKDLREIGLGDIVDEIDYRHGSIGYMSQSVEDDIVFYYKDNSFCPWKDNLAYIQTEELLKDPRQDDVFDCCFSESIYELKKGEIEARINAYTQLLVSIDKRLGNIEEFGIKCIDDSSCYSMGILRRYIVINGRPLLEIHVSLASTYRIDYPKYDYYAIKYSVQMVSPNELGVNCLNKDGKYEYQKYEQGKWSGLLDEIFALPDSYNVDVKKIADVVRLRFGKEISAEDSIRYDFRSCCYYISNSCFSSLLADFQPVTAPENIEFVGKYTSLNTLIETLKSKKMRLNSIVSMNDKTEIDFLKDVQKNFDASENDEELAVLLGNDINIISLTSKLDDLDMWRYYGDNARGVCMIFQRDTSKDQELKQIQYIEPDNMDNISKVKGFLNDLKSEGINFFFFPMLEYSHYFKHKDYENEAEYRLIVSSGKADGWFINRDNGLITPYIEMNLVDEIVKRDGYFPYALKTICLGPAFKDADINAVQIRQICREAGLTYVKVQKSEIKSYR